MYEVSENYKNVIYNEGTKNKLKVYINNEEIDENQVLEFSLNCPLFTSNTFELGTTASQSVTLKLYNNSIPDSIESVYIETGIEGEIIPLGYFNLEEISNEDDETITLSLLDNMIKFETNYKLSELLEGKESVTMLEIVQDICTKTGVELGSTSFLNADKKTALYDDTITAREYISYISELAGGYACIGRDGKLYIKQIESVNDSELSTGTELEIEQPVAVSILGNTIQDGTPTPENPIDMESVEGYNEIHYPYKSTTSTISGVTFTDNGDGTITANGTATAAIAYILDSNSTDWSANFKNRVLNKTIFLSGCPSGGSTSTYRLQLWNYNANNGILSDTGTGGTGVFSNSSASYNLAIYVWKGATLNNVTFKPMLTTDTSLTYDDYLPYGHIGLLQSGKNLLKTTNWQRKTISNETEIQDSTTRIMSDYMEIEQDEDYYATIQNTNYCYGNIALYNNSKTQFATYYTVVSQTINGTRSIKLNFPTNTKYARFVVRNIDNTSIVTLDDVETIKPMIIKSTIPTSYEPYKSTTYSLPLQQPLRKIGDYADTFVKENGVWYEKHYIGEVVLDGINNKFKGKHPTITSDTKGFYSLILTDKSISFSSGNTNTLLSNYFKEVSKSAQTAFANNSSGIWWEDKTQYCYAILEKTTLDDANEWLSSNPVTVNYILAEPTLLECTDEQIEVLNELYDLYPLGDMSYVNLLANIETNMTAYSKVSVDFNLFGSYKWKDETKITKVYSSVLGLGAGDDTGSTIYINQDNLYVTNQEDIQSIYNSIKNKTVYSFEGKSVIDPAIDYGDIILIDNKPVIFQGTMDMQTRFIADIESEIQIKETEETTEVIKNESTSKTRILRKIDEVTGQITNLVESTEEFENALNNTNTEVSNNYNEILTKLDGYATEGDIITVQHSVETIQSSANYAIQVTEDIQANGVSKVKTTTGFTFDDEGLTIEKTGAKTKSILDEKGLDIKDATGSSDDDLLFVGYDEDIGEAIVKSKNITVDKYLIVGQNTRFEDYTDEQGRTATGAFWIGG